MESGPVFISLMRYLFYVWFREDFLLFWFTSFFFEGRLRWCKCQQARLKNLHQWDHVSLGSLKSHENKNLLKLPFISFFISIPVCLIIFTQYSLFDFFSRNLMIFELGRFFPSVFLLSLFSLLWQYTKRGILLSIHQLFCLAGLVTRWLCRSAYMPTLCFRSRQLIDRKSESSVDERTAELSQLRK